MYLFFISLFLVIYVLVFPLKLRVLISNEHIKIYLFKTEIVNQKLSLAMKEIQEVTVENIENKLMSKEDLIYFNVLKKFKILQLNITINGFSSNFEILSILYGFFYGVLSSFSTYFANKNVPFSYEIKFDKNAFFELDGIFKTNLGKILLEYFRLRRIKYGRASN
jgi:hypothetical protein